MYPIHTSSADKNSKYIYILTLHIFINYLTFSRMRVQVSYRICRLSQKKHSQGKWNGGRKDDKSSGVV